MNETSAMTSLTSTKKALPTKVQLIAFIATFGGFLDTHLLVPIMALYSASIGAGIATGGLIIGIYSIANTPLNIIFGRLVDRFGRKPVLILGLLGDALAMFLYPLVRTPVHLMLIRAFHGSSGAAVGPATMSLITDYSQSNSRGKAMGFYGLAIGLAVLVGYGISGVMSSRLGYLSVFYMGAGVLLISTLVAFFIPPIKMSDRAPEPLIRATARFLSLFRRREIVVSYYLVFVQYFTFGGLVTLLPIYFKGEQRASFQFAMLLLICVAVYLLLQIPSGILSDRIGRKPIIVTGAFLASAALSGLGFARTLPALALLMAVYGAGWGLLFPSISALAMDNTAAEERGISSGGLHSLLTAGVAVGAPLLGYIGERFSVPGALSLSSITMLAGIPLTLLLLRKRRQ